ncbi:response regulator [Amycolatopsis sp. K13G38]|uniref:Transcriptional regulatory protein n=1 Tax=Amycolatopsis acididurans TaxID=2724524 RepID=A0ABX1JDR1_9PSEU|nr:response regulator [Amycolatopsis acididurans]NKQ56596.1 response regulator [Amycolatopsis acididurans]
MIRTLVVDDDYRVAAIHAAGIDRVPGFTCVGRAHSAADARRAIAELQPQLVVLDIYLPDEDGLSVLKGLKAQDQHGPDCIVITASRDLSTVRTAMRLGAVYYLVKPFGFPQFRTQLEAYRRWREQAFRPGEADQHTVDALFGMLRGPAASATEALAPTMRNVLETVRQSPVALTASTLATRLGISRPTAQRYLSELHRRGLVELSLEYGNAGRPVHRYTVPALA